MNATTAIIRSVPDTYSQCVTTQHEVIDVPLAKAQHERYASALQNAGLQLIRLPADNLLPDCCFVEDTVIVADELAIITNPGAPSRRAEVHAMEEALSSLREIRHVPSRETIDGGDVLRVGDKIFIGLSGRTTKGAIELIAGLVAPLGIEVITVPVQHTLHLKSAVTALSDSQVIMASGFFDERIFADYHPLVIPAVESYAANCLAVNETIFMPSGYPVTKSMMEAAGYAVTELDNSEFKKGDGALTCLSVLL